MPANLQQKTEDFPRIRAYPRAMKTRFALALLFFAGLAVGLVRFYAPRPAPESIPPGLRELMLASIEGGRLDLRHLALAARWDRACLLPSGTSDEGARQKLGFLSRTWRLSDHSEVKRSAVTAILLFGPAHEPVGVADIPNDRLTVPIGEGACFAKAAANFPAH